ncbi:MAG: hypothetical protein ACI8Z1_003569 [Candidatus Azotimanducaceae bacterium]|jgi:hypothetical protein
MLEQRGSAVPVALQRCRLAGLFVRDPVAKASAACRTGEHFVSVDFQDFGHVR